MAAYSRASKKSLALARGAGRDADLALIKRTAIGERMSVDFRAGIFNLKNTPPLGAPNVAVGSSAFGAITSAGDPA